MTKTLGQVAYEGWDSDVMTYTPWDEISVGFQAAWQAAAVAVAVKVLREQPNIIIADHELHPDAKQAIMENTRKHNAVIEAAKAYKHGWHNGQNMDVLRDALFETLQKLEKGDER